MKSLLRSKKQIILIASIAALLLAAVIVVYFFAINRSAVSHQNNAVQNSAETIVERSSVEEPILPSSEAQASPESQVQVVAPKTESTAPAVAPQKSAEEVRLDNMCPGVSEFISTRYSQKKDASGSPYYQNTESLLNDLKRQSPANYNFYQECVAAGKISTL